MAEPFSRACLKSDNEVISGVMGMGQAAASEPTMEEILASIRKIIAEEGSADTPVAQSAAPAPRSAAAASAAVAKPASGYDPVESDPVESPEQTAIVSRSAPSAAPMEQTTQQPVGEMATGMDKPLGGGQTSRGTPPTASPAAPRSISDIQSEVAAKLGTSETRSDTVPGQSHSRPALAGQEQAAASAASTVSAYRQVRPEAASTNSTHAEPQIPTPAMPQEPVFEGNAAVETGIQPDLDDDVIERRAMAGPAPADLEPVREHGTTPSQAGASANADEPQPPADEVEMEAFRGALMSPSTDESVHSSFERLKRSATDDLDAKTEAILRPMLREWLDENLPTLVERLVREEIERVARGNHR